MHIIIEDFGVYCGIEAGAGISTISASIGISLGRFSRKENAAGAYISYGASGGLSGVSAGYDYITNMDGDYVGNIESLGFGFGAAYAEAHARVGTTGILSLKKE